MVFGLIQNRFGLFVTRLLSGAMTTGGLFCFSLYSSSAYVLYPAMILGNVMESALPTNPAKAKEINFELFAS